MTFLDFIRTNGYRIAVLILFYLTRLLPVNHVGYLVLNRLPLCIQIQAGHQRILRVWLVALPIGAPTDEFVVCTRRQIGLLILERLIFIAGLGAVVKDFICTEIRMVGNVDYNVLDVAINMDILYPVRKTKFIPHRFALVLNGIPYDLDVFSVEVRAQNSGGITVTSIGAVFPPVVLIEETEIVRYIQIAEVIKATFGVSDRVTICLGQCLRTCCGQRTGVTSIRILTQYATVAADDILLAIIAARQVVFLTLVMVVIRLTTVRQEYEVLGCLLLMLIPCEVDVQRCRANFIFRRIAYYIIILRIVFRIFRNVGRSVVIARLRAVRIAVCAVVGRSRCGILILGRLCLGLRRSGNSGSFGGVCFNESGICHGTAFVHERLSCWDVLIADQIVGQRPTARAHGQHHDSRKSSCEQTFARILFKHMECLLSQRAC